MAYRNCCYILENLENIFNFIRTLAISSSEDIVPTISLFGKILAMRKLYQTTFVALGKHYDGRWLHFSDTNI